MTLRVKLLFAQLPLLAALLFLSLLALTSVSSIGGSAQNILRENYRSVLAAQRMKEAVERMDSGALFLVAGQPDKGLLQLDANLRRFEAELRVEEDNITERGEAELARHLRAAWEHYRERCQALRAAADSEAARDLYFREVESAFLAVKNAADQILGVNQDAMVRKSEAARRMAERLSELATAAAIAAILLGLLASSILTARILRPLSRLSQAAERIGAGDLDARAQVEGRDELARLSQDFNAMAAHLKRYRTSSLGELLQAQHAAQSAIDSLPDPVIVFGTDGAILNVNRAAETLVGSEPRPDATAPLARLDPALRELLHKVRAHVLAGKGAYVPKDFGEAVCIHFPDGDRYLLPRATPLHGEQGSIQGATAVLQDVTRLRRFDELKNDLVATVAHELRTPLTSLRMAVQLCLEGVVGPVTAKQAELLHAAREDCQRLQAITDDLLDLARLQGGRIEMRKQPLAVAALLEEVLAEARSAAEQRQVSLHAEPQPGAPELVYAERERILLVFSNLLANAIRHTPEGGSVIVRASASRAGSGIRFEVEDTGEGIPPEYQREIFRKFFRVPGRPAGGAGLGLSIVEEIVAAHGGSVGVVSEPGQGSRFYFELPGASEEASRKTQG